MRIVKLFKFLFPFSNMKFMFRWLEMALVMRSPEALGEVGGENETTECLLKVELLVVSD